MREQVAHFGQAAFVYGQPVPDLVLNGLLLTFSLATIGFAIIALKVIRAEKK